jgi:hypothetical protein
VRVGTELPAGTPAFLDYHTTTGRLEEGGPAVHGSGGERRRGSGGAAVQARRDEERRHRWRRTAVARVERNRVVDSIWGSNDLTDGSHL